MQITTLNLPSRRGPSYMSSYFRHRKIALWSSIKPVEPVTQIIYDGYFSAWPLVLIFCSVFSCDCFIVLSTLYVIIKHLHFHSQNKLLNKVWSFSFYISFSKSFKIEARNCIFGAAFLVHRDEGGPNLFHPGFIRSTAKLTSSPSGISTRYSLL